MSGRFALLLLLTAWFSMPVEAANRCVLVWLEGEPLAEMHARSQIPIPGFMQPLRLDGREMADHRARLRWQRAGVARRLEELGFLMDGETDVVLHTLMGRMPEENIEAANSIPGVRLARLVKEYKLLLDGAVPLVGADSAWLVLGGEQKAGQGIKVGIIDSGIDITHPMLQDSRLPMPDGFPKGEKQFTNSKVIVARNYLSMLGDPHVLPTAMDERGHGSFVAAIVAGRRAVSPYGDVTGMAPGAYLGSYHVTNKGSTNEAAIIAAFNDAAADGMNVINLSIGGTISDVSALEPMPQALAAAVKAGVVVAVAAGNSCTTPPCPFTVSEPATSPFAIGVGATTNQRILGFPVTVSGSGVSDNLKRIPAVAYDRQLPTAPIVTAALTRPISASAYACRALTTSEDVKGKVVLFSRPSSGTTCSSYTQIRNLADGGAVAALYYLEGTATPGPQAYYDPSATGTTAEPIPPPIPAFQLWGADGKALNDLLAVANPDVQVAIDSTGAKFPLDADQMATFSSRGPGVENDVKPDLVAPGTWIYSAVQMNNATGILYHPAGFAASNGTSFSSPIVAGAATLVRQAHPAWTPAQVKSALVNRAVAVATESGQAAPILATGAGRLDVGRALSSGAAFDPVSISFGSWYMGDPVKPVRTLTITNLSAARETYSIEITKRKDMTDASIAVAPQQTYTVAPGASTTVQVTFQGPPSIRGSALIDGRLKIHGNSSNEDYLVAFWGQVLDATKVYDSAALRGTSQSGAVSTVLASQLGLAVYSTSDLGYSGIGGIPVRFEIIDGGGSLSAEDVTTDMTGFAAVSLRLPGTAGVVHVKASVPSSFSRITPKVFTATARAALAPVPSVPAAGVVNAASYRQALAPGAIFSIFGTGLAAATEAAATLPLPTMLASAQVLFDGKPTALFYVSPTQINAQVPFELAGAATTQLQVSVTGSLSPPVVVPLSPAAPGVFTISQDGKGAAVVLHGLTSAPVTTANPAKLGEVLTLFATGLGGVQPFVPTGRPAQPQPLSVTTNPVAITLGSASARVLFSGLAPGFAGLYQVNFEVPAGSTLGDAVTLNVTVANASSNPAALPVR